MQAVNLLPDYARPSGRKFTSVGSELPAQRILYLGGLAAISAALLVGLFYFHERSLVKDDRTQLADAQARLVAQNARAQPIKDAQAGVAARMTVMQGVDTTRVHWDTVLADLGRDLPSGVVLSSLNVSGANGAAAAVPGTGGTFTIAGTTTSYNNVALLLDRLALVPWLSNVTLGSTSRSGGSSSGSTASFSISGAYTGASS
jgi:Tfp pilus assembly protein PilN